MILLALNAATQAAAPVQSLTDKQILAAIDQTKRYFYAQQRPEDGAWARSPPFRGTAGADSMPDKGVTALVVHALLLSGETPQNPPLAKAISFLQEADLDRTYDVAVRAHVWARLPPRYRRLLQRDAMWLLGAHDGKSRFRYTVQPESYDHSATQYALLGLWEAAKRGVPVPARFWQDAQTHFLNVQNNDGGWGYIGGNESKVSMTAAGLTALLITQKQLESKRGKNSAGLTESIDRGLGWLGQHFNADFRRGKTTDIFAIFSAAGAALFEVTGS